MDKPNKNLVLVSRKELSDLKRALANARAKIAALELEASKKQCNTKVPDDNGKVYLDGSNTTNSGGCGC